MNSRTLQIAYRSHDNVVRERLEGLEREAAVLRRQLEVLPATRRRKILWKVALLTGALMLTLTLVLGPIVARNRRRAEGPALHPTFNAAGWTLTVQFTEAAKCLEATIDRHDGSPQRVTCVSRLDDPTLGSIDVSFEQARALMDVVVSYEVRGTEHVSSLAFDPVSASSQGAREALSRLPRVAEVQKEGGRRFVYFTGLLTYAFTMREIRYRFDDAGVEGRVRFAPRGGPGVRMDDEMYAEVPAKACSVTIEVLFLDGTFMRQRI